MNEMRTDLAFEARDFYLKGQNAKSIDGIKSETKEGDNYKITRVKIETEEAAKKLKKPLGNYITIHSKHITTGLFTETLSILLANELESLMPKRDKKSLVFAAGLGNDKVTPDSIGPKVISELIVTRHIFNSAPEDISYLSPLCALAPGVLGITGIETAEIFRAVSDKVMPSFIIAIDALATASSLNVGTTIQLSDTGINPGSGVNNRRSALNLKTLGVPVIVIGVPTVSDSCSAAAEAVKNEALKENPVLSKEAADIIAGNIISDFSGEMMVTPKNIDAIVNRASVIISRGINMAVHKALSYSDVTDYVS